MFVAFVINKQYFKPVELSICSKKFDIDAFASCISYVFSRRDFCIPILKIPFDIIIVSIYCLKFLLGKMNKKGALKKIILASGAPIEVTCFLDSKSFFISVSTWHVISKSILTGQLIFQISGKYWKWIL